MYNLSGPELSALSWVPWNLTELLIVAVVTLVLVKYMQRPKNLPPEPRAWPILGTIPSIGDPTHIFLSKLAKRYGSVYTMFLGSQRAVVLNDFKSIKETFVQRGDVCNDRPDMSMFRYISSEKGLLSGNGKLWRFQRSLSSRVLHKLGAEDMGFASRISEWAQILLEDMEEFVERPFDPLHTINISVSNFIFSVMSGSLHGRHNPNVDEVREITSGFTDCFAVAAVLNVFPFLKYLPGDLFKTQKMLKLRHRYYQIMRSEIAMHKTANDDNQPRDLIEAYGQHIASFQSKAHKKGFDLTEDNLVYVCQDIMGGAIESTTITLCWAVLLMMTYPDIQKRVQEEIDEVVGRDRLPSWSDVSKLPYTEATLYEIMRFAPAAYLGIPHCTRTAVNVQGFDIPKGTMIIPNLWNLFRSPKSWKNPDKFDPSHFLGKDGSFTKPEEFIPFLTGRRMCPGEAIAKVELFLFFSNLMHRFSFRHPDGVEEQSIEGQAHLTYKPPPFKTHCSLRDCAIV